LHYKIYSYFFLEEKLKLKAILFVVCYSKLNLSGQYEKFCDIYFRIVTKSKT